MYAMCFLPLNFKMIRPPKEYLPTFAIYSLIL